MISHFSVISSPLGKIGIAVSDEHLVGIKLLQPQAIIKEPIDALSNKVKKELAQYFNNPAHVFSLPIRANGTPFQRKVWSALANIPSGKTITYGSLAKQLQTAPRAIGNACRSNPVGIIIPCHRVVAANHIGGYSGETDGPLLDIKKWLLNHEQQDKLA